MRLPLYPGLTSFVPSHLLTKLKKNILVLRSVSVIESLVLCSTKFLIIIIIIHLSLFIDEVVNIKQTNYRKYERINNNNNNNYYFITRVLIMRVGINNSLSRFLLYVTAFVCLCSTDPFSRVICVVYDVCRPCSVLLHFAFLFLSLKYLSLMLTDAVSPPPLPIDCLCGL